MQCWLSDSKLSSLLAAASLTSKFVKCGLNIIVDLQGSGDGAEFFGWVADRL